MLGSRLLQYSAALALATAGLAQIPASAQTLSLFSTRSPTVFDQVMPAPATEAIEEETDGAEVPAHLRRQVVSYSGREAPGTVVIDTPNTYLYYVLGGGKAVRYGIGVGREGFTWAGVQTVARKAEWPDWHPPAEMIGRQPYLPRFMAGGPGNPLGARAMYLGNSIYRIHGTNQPSTIGKKVSSGCIRMLNEDVSDLYGRVNIGTKVVVLPMNHRQAPELQDARARPVPAARAAAAGTDSTASAWNGLRRSGIY
jgi:lipoprotein-anchoring transpeptidase ErfK/SrfK